jgi:hypothetical protein
LFSILSTFYYVRILKCFLFEDNNFYKVWLLNLKTKHIKTNIFNLLWYNNCGDFMYILTIKIIIFCFLFIISFFFLFFFSFFSIIDNMSWSLFHSYFIR